MCWLKILHTLENRFEPWIRPKVLSDEQIMKSNWAAQPKTLLFNVNESCVSVHASHHLRKLNARLGNLMLMKEYADTPTFASASEAVWYLPIASEWTAIFENECVLIESLGFIAPQYKSVIFKITGKDISTFTIRVLIELIGWFY